MLSMLECRDVVITVLDEMPPLLQGNKISNRIAKVGHGDRRTVLLRSSTNVCKRSHRRVLPLFVLVVVNCSFCLAHPRRRRLQGEVSTDARALDDRTKLLTGAIVTRSNVGEYADLSWDIRDIRTHGKNGDTQRLTTLYQEGFHAVKTAANTSTGELFPLQYLSDYFSQDDSRDVVLTPNYLYHIYGWTFRMPSHSSLDDRLSQALHYQRDTIRQTIHGPQPELTADAILSLSMWMYAAHLLLESVHLCQQRTRADDASSIETTLAGDGLDEFMALWIGRDQLPGSTNTGHGLYQWTQQVGDYFMTSNPEAAANSRIRLLYHEGVTAISAPNACTSDNTETVLLLWNVATRMVREMLQPLVQWFLYHLILENQAAADLYAKALLPQMSRCRPSLYRRLEDLLRNGVDFKTKTDILRDVKDAYSECLGISCTEISNFDKNGNSYLYCDTSKQADDIPPTLAGYQASTAVAPLSRMDLDIRQIRILSSMELIMMEYAGYTYKYGLNVLKPRTSEYDPFQYLSLHELAVDASRSQADPIYSQFVSYYNSRNYADQTMQSILDGKSKWTVTAQNTEALVLTSTCQILFMEVIRLLHKSSVQCQEADPNMGFVVDSETERHPIDSAAALLIGSLEGAEKGGSVLDDGELLWNLANKKAFMFQTMNNLGYSKVNEALMNLLYAAKEELDAVLCSALDNTLHRIEQYMQVGILQVLLSAAVDSEYEKFDWDHVSLVKGEVMALSILPIMDAHDKMNAERMKKNMIFRNDGEVARDGAQAVADSVGYYITDGASIPCGIVGSTSGVDPCKKYSGDHSGSKSRNVLLTTLRLAIFSLLFLIW